MSDIASASGRVPTVSTEEEEEALESGIATTSASDVVNTTAEVAQIATADEDVGQGVQAGEGGMEVDGQEQVKVEEGLQGSNGEVKIPTGPASQQQYGQAEAEAAAQAEVEVEVVKPDPYAIPDNACETLYIQNLNEKVQVEVMKQTLQNLFKPYRPLPSVTAHRNVRMRGQAFISFADYDSANRARKDVHEFPLYGKPMIVQFARSRADVVVQKKEDAETLEEHKKARLEDKKRKRRDNPLRRKEAEKRRAAQTADAAAAASAAAPAPAPKKPKLGIPDEYLPPNNILFIQNLPEGTTQEDLREVFEQYPGLVEIRTIPAKKDIAFIEYTDEPTAITAKEALHNFKIDGETKMKVTYARK